MKKNNIFVFTLIVCICLLIALSLEARGGGGGGGRGGGGGGGYGGGRGAGGAGRAGGYNSFNRASPSMSRAQTPARDNYGMRQPQSITMPSMQNRSQMISPPATSLSRPATQVGGQSSRAQLQQFMQQNPAASQLQNRGNLGAASQVQNLGAARQTALNQYSQVGNSLRQNLASSGINNNNLFNSGFWNKYGYRPNYAARSDLWRAASWGSVNSWLGSGWSDPYYYDNGSPYTVSDSSGYQQSSGDTYNIYQGTSTQPTATAQPQQAQVVDASSTQMPLGVFALVSNPQAPSDPNMFFQLVLNKDGSITGAYFNKSVDQVYPLEGLVDKNTQQAAWKMSVGQGAPIFQTGLYNLTQQQTAVDVIFSDGSKQQWLLTRL